MTYDVDIWHGGYC